MGKKEAINLLDEYKCLKIEGDNIEGHRRSRAREGPFPNTWCVFESNTSLLKIQLALRLAWEFKWDEWHKEFWTLQDGYGKKGFIPAQGHDWSGINNSSNEAKKEMIITAERVWCGFCNMYDLEHLWPWETYCEFSCERDAADGLDKEEDYIFYGVKVYHMEEVYDKIFDVLSRMKEKDGYWSFKVEDMNGELVWSLALRWDEYTEGFKDLFERTR